MIITYMEVQMFSVKLQIRNPSYVFLVFGLTEETFIVGGLSVFGAKLFQEFHNVNIADAGFIMGKIVLQFNFLWLLGCTAQNVHTFASIWYVLCSNPAVCNLWN